MKILSISTLFPNTADPKHGIFVETRLKHFKEKYPKTELTVIAPIPWFPSKNPRFGNYARFSQAPKHERRLDTDVYHPRYLVIPKIGMLLTPFFLAVSILLCILKLQRHGKQFDLIDGHYLYPDGVAIALASLWVKIPFLLTARGTDLNLIPSYPLPRRMIVWACGRAKALITVCEALREAAIRIGIPPSKIITLRNGVDLTLFTAPTDRDALRREHGIKAPSILSVGYLIERKGHHLIIEALHQIKDAHLYIAGDGPERKTLEQLVRTSGLMDRVHFLGNCSQAELRRYYGAVDMLVLASSREGWANVLLESMACGTPVVATRVWGTPEVVRTDDVGILVERTADNIGKAINELMDSPRDRATVRAYAEQFDWDETSQGLQQLFTQAAIPL